MEIDESMPASDIKNLRDSINILQETEHIEVFKLIKKDTDKYSENKNGIFVNLSKLNYSTLKKIQDFVNFCSDNKRTLEIKNKEIDSLKEYINTKDTIKSDSENESIYSDSDSCNDEEEGECIQNISDFEKEIIYSNLKNENNNDNNFSGIRAKILKKCKDNTT